MFALSVFFVWTWASAGPQTKPSFSERDFVMAKVQYIKAFAWPSRGQRIAESLFTAKPLGPKAVTTKAPNAKAKDGAGAPGASSNTNQEPPAGEPATESNPSEKPGG